MFGQKIDYTLICLFFLMAGISVYLLDGSSLDNFWPNFKLVLLFLLILRFLGMCFYFNKYIKTKNSKNLLKSVIISMPFEIIPLLFLMFIAEFLSAIKL